MEPVAKQAFEIPSSFYYAIGFLIVTNIGSIFSFLMVGFKAVWWASKIDAKVTAAHKRLDKIEGSECGEKEEE